jgi:hypothetical protein
MLAILAVFEAGGGGGGKLEHPTKKLPHIKKIQKAVFYTEIKT